MEYLSGSNQEVACIKQYLLSEIVNKGQCWHSLNTKSAKRLCHHDDSQHLLWFVDALSVCSDTYTSDREMLVQYLLVHTGTKYQLTRLLRLDMIN